MCSEGEREGAISCDWGNQESFLEEVHDQDSHRQINENNLRSE